MLHSYQINNKNESNVQAIEQSVPERAEQLSSQQKERDESL
jgi:hypothetical protein